MNKNSFAKKLGVANTVIQNIVNGRNNPSFDLSVKICETFNVNPQWFFLEKGEMFIKEQSNNLVEEPTTPYLKSNNTSDKWKDKYIEQLELNNALLKSQIEGTNSKHDKARSA